MFGALRSQQKMLTFVGRVGGKVYFEGEQGVEGFSKPSTSPPSVFSRQNVVFVDMFGTKLNDAHVPQLIKLTHRLPSAMFLDLRRTQISIKGLGMVVDAMPALGVIADEEKLVELEEQRAVAGIE